MSMGMTGCGGGQPAISHNLRPAQIKAEILARVDAWQSTAATIEETYQTGAHTQQFQLRLMTQAHPASFSLQESSSGSPSTVWVSDSQETTRYQAGAAHYAIVAGTTPTVQQRRVLGVGLAAILHASRVQSARISGNQAVVTMISPVTSAVSAKTVLWFNLATNSPLKWQASWRGGQVTETVKSFAVNPSLSRSDFQFSPPAGVTPEVVLSQAGVALDEAKQQVTFPIVMPPGQTDLTLNQVTVNTDQGKRLVLLNFSQGNGQPVLITESSAGSLAPPAGVSLVTETVGTLSIRVGALPLGGEMAAFRVSHTLVVAEGPTAEIDSMLTAWGNLTSAPNPGSASANATPASP
ncbi:MAG: hypothetical protein M0Z53_02590 [Thermaerobacter sp.]|nr:hypothetical protein [Thermaerobacter sp.]